MFFCKPSFIKRSSSGRSAVAAAAYRAGERLHDDETGKNWKYDKKEVIDKGIVLPENAPAEYKDRQTLWNAVQKAEQSADARLARELVVAIPHDLDKDAAKIMIHDFAAYLAKRGMCVDYALHWKNGNHHAHIMLTTRQIDKNGEWAKYKEKKVYARDEQGNKIPLLDKDGKQKTKARKGKGVEKLWKRVSVIDNPWNKKAEYENWKRRLARLENRELIKAGSDVRVDSRSYKERGIDKVPQVHEGYAARAIEKRGEKSFLCEHNREVRALNAKIEQTQKIEKRIAELKKQKEEQQKQEQKPEQNAQPLKDENITICGFVDLSNAEQKEFLSKLPPRLQRQPLSIKNKKAREELVANQKNILQNAVFAKNESGKFVMLDLNKKQAYNCGLMKTIEKDEIIPCKKTIKSSQLEKCISKMPPDLQKTNRREFSRLNAGGGGGVSKGIQKGIDGMTGALDTEKTSKQHFKAVKENVKEALATPKKVIEDFISNPITALLKAPFRVAEGAANLASAAANATAGAAKSGTMLSESNGNSGGGASADPVRVRTRGEDEEKNGLDSWKYLSEARRAELELKQNLKEYHI